MKQTRILLSNDDGIDAKGLVVLSEIVKDIAVFDIVAPDRNRSGASNSLTIDAPLRVRHIASNKISVQGTPTDCVHLAITGLLSEMPDMVVSGINEGANLGDDVWYSGTVAAAMEGRFLGLPAMAISVTSDKVCHYETASKVAQKLIKRLIADPLPSATILNVNVPDIPYTSLQSYEVTRLGCRHRAEKIIREWDPRGHPIYWIGAAGPEQDAGPGTDFYAVNHHAVSITPLHVDLTHYESFEQLSGWVTRSLKP